MTIYCTMEYILTIFGNYFLHITHVKPVVFIFVNKIICRKFTNEIVVRNLVIRKIHSVINLVLTIHITGFECKSGYWNGVLPL